MPSASRAVPLARRLRELRRQVPNLTQAALASAFSTESSVAPATLSSWESTTNPKTPPASRLHAYARFFASDRSFDGERALLPAEDELDEVERERFHDLRDELLALLRGGAEGGEEPEERRTPLDFDEGQVVIICPEAPVEDRGALGREGSPNFSRLHQFADADALIELFGHLRALNPRMKVFYRTSTEVRREDLQHHLVLLGGVGWNTLTKRVQDRVDRLPIEQVEDERLKTGDIFRLKAEVAGDDETTDYFPVTDENGELIEDVALIARVPNPFNYGRTLTICNGIHSRGVVGAVLAFTDETVRPANENYFADNFMRDFAILVRVPVVEGDALAPDLKNPEALLYVWAPDDSEEQ